MLLAQVLDIGRCRSLWRLPGTLLALPELRRLVLATKAVGQHVVEQLELRSPNPVDVEFEGDAQEDDWDMESDGSEGFGVVGGDMPPLALVYGSEDDVTETESEVDEEGVPGLVDYPDLQMLHGAEDIGALGGDMPPPALVNGSEDDSSESEDD